MSSRRADWQRWRWRWSSVAAIPTLLGACSTLGKDASGGAPAPETPRRSETVRCKELQIEPPPEPIVRDDPNAVARAFAYWCQHGNPDAIDARLPQLAIDKSSGFSTFLRSVCEEFSTAPEVPSMSDDEKRFLTAAVWLRPEGTVHRDGYTVWYYSILDQDRRPTAPTSWLSLHCDGPCAPTGIFWSSRDKQYPMPGGLTKCSRTR
jgi:hypothetical protein